MRTTIDIPNDKIARLRALAAERGLRGYSEIIQEAIDLYLRHLQTNGRGLDEVLALAGSWSEEDCKELEDRTREFWGRWSDRS